MKYRRAKAIALSPKQIKDEVNRQEAKRRRDADKLYYDMQIEALKGDKKPQKPEVTRNFTLNLTIPSFSSIKNRLKSIIASRNFKLAVGAACLGLVALISFNLLNNNNETPQVAGSSQTEKANFSPLVPTDEKGTKKDVMPKNCSNNAKLICFEDKYLSGQMNITQQKLGTGQTVDPSKLTDIAKASFSETSAVDYDTFATKNGNAVVVSYQDISSQRAVYLSKDMLVFIETEKTYDKEQWSSYFNSLKV